MKQVLYLSFVISKEKSGFVFPAEIDDANYYAPGIFIIEGKSYYNLEDEYLFRAFQNEKIKIFTLQRVRKNIYRVRIDDNTDIYFKAKYIPKDYSYLGNPNRFNEDSSFYELIELQSTRLEELCKTKNFFFIGSIE